MINVVILFLNVLPVIVISSLSVIIGVLLVIFSTPIFVIIFLIFVSKGAVEMFLGKLD